MSMTIGGITLDNDMYWEDEFQHSYGTGVADRAIDGTLVLQQSSIPSGQMMTLSGDQNHGWQTRTTVQALLAFSEANAGTLAPFAVVLNGRNFSCVFRFEESPPVAFNPITLASNPPSTMPYYGTIKLRIVA